MKDASSIQNTEIPAVYSSVKKAQRRARARELLSRLGLEDRWDYRPSQLSGGQQQRVSIARALMNGGDVILADEPTGALDSKSGQEMMNILLELHGLGHTIILVTHDMQVANNAERIIEISDGEIIRDQPNPNTLAKDKGALPEKPLVDEPVNPLQAYCGRFAEAFRMALIAMASHRMRTLLTMLGIIIGITSVVSVVALGQGARQKVINDISSMGTNVIDIYPGKDWGDEDAGSIYTLVPADLEALKSQVYVDSATPGTSTSLSSVLQNPVAALGAGLTLPFLQWNTMQLNVRISEADYQAAVVTFRQTLYAALGDVENALSGHTQYEAEGKQLEEALSLARRAEDLAEIRYRAGYTALQAWLDTQQSRRSAEKSLAANRLNRLNNLMTLYQALGGEMGNASEMR